MFDKAKKIAEVFILNERELNPVFLVAQAYLDTLDKQKDVISEFNEDEIPVFTQGYPVNVLQEIVTADRCNWLVHEIARLRKEKEGMVLLPENIVEILMDAYNGGAVKNASLYEAIVKLDKAMITKAKDE